MLLVAVFPSPPSALWYVHSTQHKKTWCTTTQRQHASALASIPRPVAFRLGDVKMTGKPPSPQNTPKHAALPACLHRFGRLSLSLLR